MESSQNNISIFSFFRWLLIVLFFGALISLIPIFKTQESSILLALIIAPLVSAINFFTGALLAERGMGASQNTFLKLVFGGMGVRLLILGAIVAAVYRVQKIDFMTFLIALFLYYTVMLGLEVLFISKRMKKN